MLRSNPSVLLLTLATGALLGAANLAAWQPEPCQAAVDVALQGDPIAYGDVATHERVQPRIEAALACLRGRAGEDRARLLDRLTANLYRINRDAEALPIYDAFFSGLTEGVSPDIVSRMYSRRGSVYSRMGRQRESIEQYSRAAYSVPGVSARQRYWALYVSGRAFVTLRDYEQAHQYYLAADSLLQRLTAQDSARYSPLLGDVRAYRADAILRASERRAGAMERAAAEAYPLIHDALERTLSQPDKRIFALVIYARAQRWEGNYEASLRSLAEAERLMRRHPGAVDQPFNYTLKGSKGWAHFALGQYDQAEAAFREGYEAAKATQWTAAMMSGLVELGFIAEARGTPDGLDEAERLFREAAVFAEMEREALGLSEWSVANRELTRTPYLALIRILVKQGRVPEALQAFDEMQARHLRDLRAASTRMMALDVTTRTRLDSLTRGLHALRFQLGADSLSLHERALLQSDLDRVERERERITGGADQYTPLSIPRLQEELGRRGQTLLAYALAEDYGVAPGSGYAFAFVVRPDTVLAVSLPTTELELTQAIDSLADTWDTARPGLDLRPLHRLYRQLIAPVEPLLEHTDALAVIPSGPLARLPFSILIDQPLADRFAYRDARYLVRRYPITTELAPSLITAPRPTPSPTHDMLALGRSTYEGMTISTLLDGTEDELADLPNVREEVASLHRLLRDGLYKVDAEASETYFRTHLGDARTLHLAGHALVDPDRPMYSQVILSASDEDDGILHLFELKDAVLHADLVTLSGCGTARGIESPSEGMMGLQYAFRAAGAGATLATLWQVDDAATVELMRRFYRNLKRGLPKDRALQEAQLGLLDERQDLAASPFYWAAPVLYGDPGPVKLTQSGPPPAFWLTLGLALIAAAIAGPRLWRRRGATREVPA